MDLLDLYWREVLVAGMACTFGVLFLKTETLRPVVTIFGAAAISAAMTIEAPTAEAAKALIAGIRDTVLRF